MDLSANEIKHELGLTPNPTWRLVTDEAVRQLYLGYNAAIGDVWINDEHGICVWVNASGTKTMSLASKSVALDVPPPQNDGAKKV